MRYSIIPIKGLVVEQEFIFSQKNTILWGITNPSDNKFYSSFTKDDNSLKGNLEMIRKRLQPSAFLFALNPNIERQVWDDSISELILACLSITLNGSGHLDNPFEISPIFRKRFLELADLPLSFTKESLKSVGHTSRIGLFSWEDMRLSDLSLAEEIKKTSGLINDIFNYRKLKASTDNLLSYIRIFDNTNVGGFITSILASLENVISYSDKWKIFESKLKFLFPSASGDISLLFKERNDYVHRGKLPVNDSSIYFGLKILSHLLTKENEFQEKHPKESFKKYLDIKYRIGEDTNLIGINFDIKKAT